MRIFSNFDTKLKRRSYERYQKQYGTYKVVLLCKSVLFGFFKFYLPLIAFLLVSVGLLLGLWLLFGDDALLFVGLPLFVLSLFFVSFPLLRNLIEYKMDFSIVTPKLLIMYDQKGIFKRQIKTINAENIKTISISKDGFRYSVFNNGDLTFLSEGGELEYGEVILHYIYKPEKQRHMIAQVLGRA